MKKEEKMVELSHIQKKYGKNPVLSDISFQLQRGQVAALIRKNGRSPAKIPLYSVYNPSISLGLQREDRQIDKNS